MRDEALLLGCLSDFNVAYWTSYKVACQCQLLGTR